jgi:hypothetical protein
MTVERTMAGLQLVIPGCEWRTLPVSTTKSDEVGQGLLGFYNPPTLREKIASSINAPLRPRQPQKPLPRNGLFAATEPTNRTLEGGQPFRQTRL